MKERLHPSTTLFGVLFLALAGSVAFSSVRIGYGDLPGAEYYIFPFLHHSHGEFPAAFLPGSFAFNFLIPSYLVSIVIDAFRRERKLLAITETPFFFYVWFPSTAIVDVAADTLGPTFLSGGDLSIRPFVAAVHGALLLAVVVGHYTSRGTAGEW